MGQKKEYDLIMKSTHDKLSIYALVETEGSTTLVQMFAVTWDSKGKIVKSIAKYL
jgi:hypothetical protein